MKKRSDCVELQHEGGARVAQRLSGMTPEERAAYWREKTEALRELQRSLRGAAPSASADQPEAADAGLSERPAVEELDEVVLAADLPEHGLSAGDIGTVVFVHWGNAAFEVEFATLEGETVAVLTVRASQVRPVRPREIAHARQMAT